MLTTAIPYNGLYSYSVRRTQYDRLSQQQLSFFFLCKQSYCPPRGLYTRIPPLIYSFIRQID